MNTISLRKSMSATAFGAAVSALTIGALAQPAVSSAERIWDIGAYDSCMKAADRNYNQHQDGGRYADEIRFCCDSTGGQWSWSQGCTAPPATAQTAPQAPWEAGRAPKPESAAGGQTPGTENPTPPPAAGAGTPTVAPRNSGWGWVFTP